MDNMVIVGLMVLVSIGINPFLSGAEKKPSSHAADAEIADGEE
jgi:hypothetical protein